MWLRHWGLTSDPFSNAGSSYVALPSHEEAVARLLFAIGSGQRRVSLVAERGLGKTVVLRRALAEATGPRRRIVSVSCPPDELLLLIRLAEGLGQRALSRRVTELPGAWRVLERAMQLQVVQGFAVVLAVDNCEALTGELAARVLKRVSLILGDDVGAVTMIRVGAPAIEAAAEWDEDWPAVAALDRFTRSEAAEFLSAKLEAVGGRQSIFSIGALTRLHGLTLGIPRELERLAGLSLMAGAVLGLATVTAEVVEGLAPKVAVRPVWI